MILGYTNVGVTPSIGVGCDLISIGAALSGAGAPIATFVSVSNTLGYAMVCEQSPVSLANTVTTITSTILGKFKGASNGAVNIFNIIITDIDAGIALAGIDIN